MQPTFDAVYSFDTPPLFSTLYNFEEVIAVSEPKKRVIILKFVRKEDQKMVAVRGFPNDYNKTPAHLRLLFRVEQMRKDLNLHCLVQLHGYCKIRRDPFQQYVPNQPFIAPLGFDVFYWYIIMDYVPRNYKNLHKPKLNGNVFLAFLVDLLYTMWEARRHFQFYHGDIQPQNIMFLPIPEYDSRRTRTYKIEGMQFKVNAPYLPVLVDFELSQFGNDGEIKRELRSDVSAIVIAVDEILTTTYQFESLPLYDDLRNQVLAMPPYSAFEDSRFTPEKIVEILHTHALFANLRTPIQGGEEPPLTKYKKNM